MLSEDELEVWCLQHELSEQAKACHPPDPFFAAVPSGTGPYWQREWSLPQSENGVYHSV